VIDYNVFEGIKVQGLPRFTLSRGSVVYSDGKVTANNGRGKFVQRAAFPAEARALAKYRAFTEPKGVAR
jgi:dihydropyrimidinase